MVNGRPNRRNLPIRRRWQGRNAQDRMNLSYLNKVCRFFLLTAIMLPAGEMQRAMRAISYIVFIKILSIDEWNNLPADRVEATDVTIDNSSASPLLIFAVTCIGVSSCSTGKIHDSIIALFSCFYKFVGNVR